MGLGINMSTGDAFARGNGAGAAAPPPGSRGAQAPSAAPMEEEEEDDDDDDGPPPLEVRGVGAGIGRLQHAWFCILGWGKTDRRCWRCRALLSAKSPDAGKFLRDRSLPLSVRGCVSKRTPDARRVAEEER